MKKIKKTICVFIASVLLVGGCANTRPYTKEEKFLFGTMVAANLADWYTTKRILDKGGREFNPILGDHPSNEEVFIFKAGVVGLFYGLGELFPEHRKIFLLIGTIAGAGPAAHNYYVLEKHKD